MLSLILINPQILNFCLFNPIININDDSDFKDWKEESIRLLEGGKEAFEERKRLITEGLARDEFFNQAYKMSKKLHYNLPESTQDSQEKYYY